jgi:hypothetical protein
LGDKRCLGTGHCVEGKHGVEGKHDVVMERCVEVKHCGEGFAEDDVRLYCSDMVTLPAQGVALAMCFPAETSEWRRLS